MITLLTIIFKVVAIIALLLSLYFNAYSQGYKKGYNEVFTASRCEALNESRIDAAIERAEHAAASASDDFEQLELPLEYKD